MLQYVHLFSHMGVHFVILCNAEGFRVVAYCQVAGICSPRARGVKRQGLPPIAAALPSVISTFQRALLADVS